MRKLKPPSEKSFGITFSVIFFGVTAYFYFKSGNFNNFLFITGFLLILISFVSPKLLKFPNFLWFKFGIFLSKIMTPLILTIIFYVVVAPMGIVYKLFNKNNKKTTWQIPKQKEEVDFNKQY
tara:strand:- start:671 stop:1036 length:366 start_codon:yes stop_codon:yes gene_type:complete